MRIPITKFGSWCRKMKEPGFCFCVLCNRKLNYGSNGKKALMKHSNDPAHQRWVRAEEHAETVPRVAPVQAKLSYLLVISKVYWNSSNTNIIIIDD